MGRGRGRGVRIDRKGGVGCEGGQMGRGGGVRESYDV